MSQPGQPPRPPHAPPSVAPLIPRVAPLVPPVAPVASGNAQPSQPSAAMPGGGLLTKEELAALHKLATSLNGLDYFELLGVEKGAGLSEIKRAFYKASRTWHPDRFFHLPPSGFKNAVQEVYKRITEAYAVLRDDVRRPKYLADVTGPDRAARLRFSETSEVEAKAEKQKEREEQVGTTPKGRQFYATGMADLAAGRFAAAERSLKMALTFEPQNALYKDKLKEASDKNFDEQRRTGAASFKIK